MGEEARAVTLVVQVPQVAPGGRGPVRLAQEPLVTEAVGQEVARGPILEAGIT